ncbi:hypothetical protein AVEN_145498-1 [Araneus ventricosus]|uniref:Uncharacterized protein n=1 Tax=Araneus ventricosus TaxID=182803 RepID=A0A4Y2JIQ6_ARAVE|nr:hypothetical protein AVEN_145498-1 [Araneus ventricosus]
MYSVPFHYPRLQWQGHGFGTGGFKVRNPILVKIRRVLGLLLAKSYVRSQMSSRRCGAKVPTLARRTQKGCKAGRGPAGREPLHQHMEDGIYWVQ